MCNPNYHLLESSVRYIQLLYLVIVHAQLDVVFYSQNSFDTPDNDAGETKGATVIAFERKI